MKPEYIPKKNQKIRTSINPLLVGQKNPSQCLADQPWRMDLTSFFGAALWYHLQVQQAREEKATIYHRATRVAFTRLPRWEPWYDERIPTVRFVELFRLSLADFMWLSGELRVELAQDPLGRGQPLSVEGQVAVGLYRLGHGATYVTIGHVFNIGKETADKACGRFVKSLLKVFRVQAIK